MKRNILIYALGGADWIGGIYYIKNLLFQLSISDKADSKYNYYIYVDNSVLVEFEQLIESMKIKPIEYDGTPEQLLSVCTDYEIDVVFPIYGVGYTWIIKDLCLYWIPDFQEIHFPENFSIETIENRKFIRGYIAKEHKAIILSSQDAFNDYKGQYPENVDNVFIVHFVSYITYLMGQITEDFEKNVIQKYGLKNDYIYVANQFWKHKNYIVVLKAMDKIINRENKKIHLVCTGFMQSYGEKDEYVEGLYRYIEEHNLQDYIQFLGVVERKEQLCIMKNAQLFIQPSKFEGWGCSVEDAKVMAKVILLSDIDVHKEQQYAKSILFPQDDSSALSILIMNNIKNTKKYDLEYGNQYMMEKAYQYSLELQNAIDFIQIKEGKDYLAELNRLRVEKVLRLFGDLPSNQICIYGVGWLTKQILKSCRQVLDDVQFVYSDSDNKKWGMRFEEGTVYPPSEILNLGIKRIVISSIKYQEEIYQLIKKSVKGVEIVKIFNSDKEKNEMLWL